MPRPHWTTAELPPGEFLAEHQTDPVDSSTIIVSWGRRGGRTYFSGEPLSADLIAENSALRLTNAELWDEISHLAARVEVLETEGNAVVVLREIPRDEAKAEIKAFFSQKGTLNYETIVTELGIDLQLTVELCDELIGEGEIGPVDDSA